MKPELHAREPEQRAWKERVLRGEVRLDEIDTTPYRDRYGPNTVQIRPAAE